MAVFTWSLRNYLRNEEEKQQHIILSQHPFKVERLKQLHTVINTLSLLHQHIRKTQQNFGIVDCLSCLHVISADVLPWADLILGKGKWTGEIDGGVPSQTDNTWFCLQGVGLAHSSPAPQMRRRLCWGGEPFLHSMQIQGHIQRWSQDDWANVAPSTLHHMIHASATPGRNPPRHGGHLFNTGASCISLHSNKHTHSHTLECALRDAHMPQCTCRYTSVNEMLSLVNVVMHWKNVCTTAPFCYGLLFLSLIIFFSYLSLDHFH